MTDAELTRLAATEVMGWSFGPPHVGISYAIYPNGEVWSRDGRGRWDPFLSDSDAFTLVDALATRGLRVLIEYRQSLRDGPPEWVVRFGDGELTTDPDRRRAIVLGALKACEVAVEV